MIQYITSYESKKTGKTHYRVTYKGRAKRFTSETLPRTAKRFIQTHGFEKTQCGMLFR